MSDTKNLWLSVTSSKRTAVLCGPGDQKVGSLLLLCGSPRLSHFTFGDLKELSYNFPWQRWPEESFIPPYLSMNLAVSASARIGQFCQFSRIVSAFL